MNKRIIIFILLLIIIGSIKMNACGRVNSNIKGDEKNQLISSANENISDNQGIRDFISAFTKATHSVDSNSFKELIDKDGIYSITYFEDGRDRNVVIHFYNNEIGDDLILANSKKTGIGLAYMNFGILANEVESMPIYSSKLLNDISFNVDWHINDESMVEKKLEDIIKTCQSIILTNNEYIPQVFVLKDNLFAFAESNTVLEPYPGFTGNWVIFEKVGNEYKIRVVMVLQ